MTINHSSKQGPVRWLFSQARGVFQRLRRVFVPDPKTRDRYTERKAEKAEAERLVEQVKGGEITIQSWQDGFRGLVKKVFTNQYTMARGGQKNMGAEDWGSLGGMIKKQYDHAQRFAQGLVEGNLSEGQAKMRAKMYVQAATQAFERGDAARHGVRAELPQYPGDGNTVCLTNCQCTWEIKERKDRFDCYWRLGQAEHCPDCIENAGKWKPFVVPKVSDAV